VLTNNGMPSPMQILRSFAALVSGTSLARVMTAAALILLARQIGPEGYGQYLACFSLARLTSVVFAWGFDGWLLWRGGQTTSARAIAVQSGNAIVWKLLLGAVWCAGLMLLAPLLNPAVFPPTVLLMTALFVWTDDLINTVWSVFKSTLQNDVTFKIITLVQLALLGVTIALIQLGSQQLIAFLVARLIVSAIGCLAAVAMLRSQIGIGFDGSSMLPMFRAAAPFAGSLLLAVIYERVDVAIVAQFLGAQQAGIYGPASTIVTTLFLAPAAAYYVMVPVFTRAHAQRAAFGKMLGLFVVLNAAMGVVLAGALFLASDWIIGVLYGAEYESAGPILAILSLVLGLRCVTFALAAAVVGTGQQGRRLTAQAVTAGLSIVVNLILVTRFGIRGVAWVYVLTELSLLIGYWLALGRWRLRPLSQTNN
jgi:O-antigen/teichoic acid export membrane protein